MQVKIINPDWPVLAVAAALFCDVRQDEASVEAKMVTQWSGGECSLAQVWWHWCQPRMALALAPTESPHL